MLRYLTFIGILLIGLWSCKGNGKGDPCAVEYDQTALLTNIADNFITPWYDELKTKVDSLHSASQTFSSSPVQANLDALRTAWWEAQLVWQKAKIFEFGPAEDHLLRSMLNSYPVFTGRLESAVSTGNYNLEIDSFSFTRGFPALDYLLYGVAATDADIVNLYDTDVHAASRRQFLLDVVNQIKTKVDNVHLDWNGGYATTFKTTTGVANNQPISQLVNQLNQNYELFKNDKLGTPVGAKNSYIASPDKVEAYYSRRSKELALTAVQAMKEVFTGGTGQGLDDYLAAAETDKDGQPLETVINEQFDLVISNLQALPGASLYDAIQNNFEDMKTAYANAQNQVVYLKTDLPSVLCVSITYVDNTDDGD